MIDLFYSGGPLFMSILTIIAAVMLALATVNGRTILFNKTDETTSRKLSLIKEVGLLALVCGIFATSIGLFSAFRAIEMAGDVSFGMMVGGLKVAMITILYGFIIYMISLLIWLLLNWKIGQQGF